MESYYDTENREAFIYDSELTSKAAEFIFS